MTDPVRNERQPGDLTETDVDAAISRMETREPMRGLEARDVYLVLTAGEGPGVLTQMTVQDWLWYQLPTKYLTDDPGRLDRTAGVAAELFDELGLAAYAAVCRSGATAAVFDGFARSERAGFDAMVAAMDASGVRPPSLDDFRWGRTMGVEEAHARSAAEDALERAIAGGRLVAGSRGWRTRQRAVVAATLDADHPVQPGQSWRTAILTERVGHWTEAPAGRSEPLARARARVGNRLLTPIAPPAQVSGHLRPARWFLDEFGSEQGLTSSGYLNTTFLQRVDETKPWAEPYAPPRVRSETDAMTVHRLRWALTAVGALRRQGRVLKRTAKGEAMLSDPRQLWTAFTTKVPPKPWPRFAVETIGLLLVDRGGAGPVDEITGAAAEIAAQMGWRSSGRNGVPPSADGLLWAAADTLALFELFGLLHERGDWTDRRWTLDPAGQATVLAVLRHQATGPLTGPY